jgi:hypothetical protein
MEDNEASELKETAEKGSENQAMRPVAFTMSVLAVLVAVTTVLGHRTDTEAVITQNKATDQWNFYQSHKSRSSDTELMSDLLSVVAVSDAEKAKALEKKYADHQAKWADDLKDAQQKAEELEKEVHVEQARADRFDLAEALLEIGLVITSVTLLTRSRIYWYFGFAFAAAGILSGVSAFLFK